MMFQRLGDESAQMTIEFAVAAPLLLIVAVIGINAALFFSECAAFDRLFRQEVSVHAPSPGYGRADSAASIEQGLAQGFDAEWLSVSVSSSGESSGLVVFRGRLDFSPVLPGRGAVGSVFGVSLPPLSHESRLVVDVYRPGAVL